MTSSKLSPPDTRLTFLPFSTPTIGEEEIDEVADSLRSGWVTTGPKVKRFEAHFSDYTGASHSVAVSSCTAGLHLALAALGIGPGDEVILPTYTFCSTANVVVHLGAKPVLVDVGSDCSVTPQAIEQAITPKTKAIIPVHFGGQACSLEVIYGLAAAHKLPLVEDAAHAVGSSYHGQKIGSDALIEDNPDLVRVAVFSFYPTKNMTTGEGGEITTLDGDLAQKMRTLSLHGMSRDAWKRYTSAGSWYYEVVAAGYKYNMTDIQAAMGLHQLVKLDGFIRVRGRFASMYDRAFAGLLEVRTPLRHDDRDHIFHLYTVQLDLARLAIDRAQFIELLSGYNIGASVHFIPVHMHPYYQDTFGYREGDFPMAESIYERIVSLPLYPRMSDNDVAYVIDVVKYLIESNRKLSK